MTDTAQSFWLEHLKSASHYNRWIFSQILPYLGQDILEVGCGNGNFTEFLVQQDASITAIDLDEGYVKAAQQRLAGNPNVKVLVADATQMTWTHSHSMPSPNPFPENSFDTIVLLDVLEHIENDVKVLQQLSGGLRSGGRLIVKVPALNWLYSPMDQAIGHHRRYTQHSIQTTFRQAGFLNPLIWYFNVAGIPGWWLNGQLLQRTTPPAEQIGWFDRAVPLLQAIESRMTMPIGLSLFAVATKT